MEIWRIYGIKIDPETGEIIQDRTLIFAAIRAEHFRKTGREIAEANGYTITEIWRIGGKSTNYQDRLVYFSN